MPAMLVVALLAPGVAQTWAITQPENKSKTVLSAHRTKQCGLRDCNDKESRLIGIKRDCRGHLVKPGMLTKCDDLQEGLYFASFAQLCKRIKTAF
jgi:hypothetical protein